MNSRVHVVSPAKNEWVLVDDFLINVNKNSLEAIECEMKLKEKACGFIGCCDGVIVGNYVANQTKEVK